MGRPEEALRHYESVYPVAWFGYRVSSTGSGGLDRFQRAEALEHAGRLGEALGWYAGLGQFSTFDLVYAPVGYFQRGKLLERRNEKAAAAAAYAKFIDMWGSADAEYQPLVREARQRLVILRSGG